MGFCKITDRYFGELDMYFERNFLLDLYGKMSSLYSGDNIEAQGGTQFVSELKYFLAADEFKKETSSSCNSRLKEDKDFFIECVGTVVFLSETINDEYFYTKNFGASFGESKDYDVGSNFFSVNVVKTSLHSDAPQRFPSRHPQLLEVVNGCIDVSDIGYQNIAEDYNYLGGDTEKFALLFLWLNRYTDFSSEQSVYEDGLKNLKKTYSSKLINALQWNKDFVRDEIESFLHEANFSEDLYNIQKEDLLEDTDDGAYDETVSQDDSDEDHEFFVLNPIQLIYYGVPGSGKSHTIDGIIKEFPESQKIRVVFHPEYTNADFVGQVLPKSEDGNIKYEFKPGPFTKLLYRAYHNPENKYFLVIEEINRGNAAAIFGDIFQLLDRIKKGDESETLDGNTYGIGWSKYFVENDYINNYLRSPLEYNQNGFTENHGEAEVTFGDGITFTANTGIRLPPNLSLYATMNTSDQNVFTLDNAFQRRWDMTLVKNECDDDEQIGATITANDHSITWRNFQQQINKVIGEKSNENGLSSMEDKRLGCWFVKAENKAIPTDVFANKVLKYLWDDAFKFCHQEVFADGIKNFEELQKKFGEVGFDVFQEVCGLKEFVQ